MSDLHALPLRGHDLPDPAPQAPVRHKAQVKVFKDHKFWTWYHVCGTTGAVHLRWSTAFGVAYRHAQVCPR